MARDGWFDEKGIELRDKRLFETRQSWKDVVEDGVITYEEIDKQKNKIVDMLKKLETQLSDEIHKELTEILLEYEVLLEMYHYDEEVIEKYQKKNVR